MSLLKSATEYILHNSFKSSGMKTLKNLGSLPCDPYISFWVKLLPFVNVTIAPFHYLQLQIDGLLKWVAVFEKVWN